MLPTPVFDPAFPVAKIQDSPNVRAYLGTEAALRELGESLLGGQLQNIGVTEGGRRLWGARRIAAARLVGIATLKAMVFPDSITDEQATTAMVVENLHRAEMSEIDTFHACEQLEKSGMTRSSIAKAISKSAGLITTYLSPNDVPPEVKAAFLEGKLKLGQVYKCKASHVPIQTMDMFLGGATREEVKQQQEAMAEEQEPQPKPGTTDKSEAETKFNLKIPFAGGNRIVISGSKMKLSAVADLLALAQKEAEKAVEQGLSPASFANVMRDRAMKPPGEPKKGRRKATGQDAAAAG